jgi:hypothetical protein
MRIKADTRALARYIALLDLYTEMSLGDEVLSPETFRAKEDAYMQYFNEFDEEAENKAFDIALDLLIKHEKKDIGAKEVKQKLFGKLSVLKYGDICLN